MELKIPVVDDLAWLMFRFIGLLQANFYEIWCMLKQPEKLSDKIHFMGAIFGGYYIFSASDPNSVPKIIHERGILVGRIILLVSVVSLFQVLLGVLLE